MHFNSSETQAKTRTTDVLWLQARRYDQAIRFKEDGMTSESNQGRFGHQTNA
jgi:hypothetical protein